MPRRKFTIELRDCDFDAIKRHCENIDEPMATWARRQLKDAVEVESHPLQVPLHPAWILRFNEVCRREGISPVFWLQRQIEAKIRGMP
jgi:hypothetical protein